MAVPKKRTSIARKGLRRAGQHHRLKPTFPHTCPNCENPVLFHTACPACGHYRGKEIFAVKVKENDEDGQDSEQSNPANTPS